MSGKDGELSTFVKATQKQIHFARGSIDKEMYCVLCHVPTLRCLAHRIDGDTEWTITPWCTECHNTIQRLGLELYAGEAISPVKVS